MDAGLMRLLYEHGIDPSQSGKAPATTVLSDYLTDVPGNNALPKDPATLLRPLLEDRATERTIEPISAAAFAKNLTLRPGKAEDRYGFLSSANVAAADAPAADSGAKRPANALKLTIKMGTESKRPNKGSLTMKLSTKK
eukprot:m.24262 g.24262  ORF g.24262 m.24262 type:complete len:139 (+) comp11485_c0_seq2:82-498(+)